MWIENRIEKWNLTSASPALGRRTQSLDLLFQKECQPSGAPHLPDRRSGSGSCSKYLQVRHYNASQRCKPPQTWQAPPVAEHSFALSASKARAPYLLPRFSPNLLPSPVAALPVAVRSDGLSSSGYPLQLPNLRHGQHQTNLLFAMGLLQDHKLSTADFLIADKDKTSQNKTEWIWHELIWANKNLYHDELN